MADVSDLLSEIMDQVNDVPPTKIAAILAQLASVQNTLVIRLLANGFEQKTSDCVTNENQLITAKDAAALLGLKPNYVLALARNKNIPSIKQGRYVRFSRSDLREWIHQKQQMSGIPHIAYNVSIGRKGASTNPKPPSVYASRIRGPRRRRIG